MDSQLLAQKDVWFYGFLASNFLAVFLLLLFLKERQQKLALGNKLERLSRKMLDQLETEEASGLLTRFGFEAALDKGVQGVDSQGGEFCVLYLALDNFALLNDGFGHQVGEALLQDVSQRLASCVRNQARICRISAGEFAIIASGGIAIGRMVAKNIIKDLAEPFQIDSMHTQLSCSIGIAVYPEHGSRSMLFGNASLAMKSVKLNGGGDFCQYDLNMGVEVREQAMLVNDLRNALEQGQFELYFQPKIDALSLQVTAAEALLRWCHPVRGFVSPVVFIPLAERFGLIGAIGNWVIEEACRKAASWREHGLRMRVAVNISPYQMREDDLVERIEAALQRHGLQPGRFTCEITESAAMEDTKVTLRTFEKMRHAGFHVSIDDFGTGYSSLATLRRLPAAELKIDRAFVLGLEESEDARTIIQTIVNMASALNLRVVAEGVETHGQKDLLISMGCHELQGFLFSLPIPADELKNMALENLNPGKVEFRKSLFAETSLTGLN